MLLLFGTRASATLLAVVTFLCRYCGVEASQEVTKLTTTFTLFFVPLFPVGSRYENVCGHCGGATELTRAQADHARAWAAGSLRSGS